MRGNYKYTHEERKRFFRGLLELCDRPKAKIDLVSTQLSMCNCHDALEELGYERGECDINGWEGEMWWTFEHTSAPGITINAEAYNGGLDLMFTSIDDAEDPDTEALKELMRERWGEYFPVI